MRSFGTCAVVWLAFASSSCTAQLPNGMPAQDAGLGVTLDSGSGPGAVPARFEAGASAMSDACTGEWGWYDPHHCGPCGPDCGGGECDYGTCAPLPAGVLATGQGLPQDIAVDEANVYWLDVNPPAVLKCAKRGCANKPTVLVAGSWSTAGRMAVDATNVYFTADDEVLACPIAGCSGAPSVVLRNSAGMPGAVAVDATNVYAGDTDTVISCPKGSCPFGTEQVWSAQGQPPPVPDGGFSNRGFSVSSLADDMTTLYALLVEGAVMACPLGRCSSGTSWPVIGELGVVDMSLGPSDIFLVTNDPGTGRLLKCAKGGCGGAPTTLASNLSGANRVVSDGSNIYVSEWTEGSQGAAGSGRITTCPVDGCPSGASPFVGYADFPLALALDDANLYWTESGSGGVGSGRIACKSK